MMNEDYIISRDPPKPQDLKNSEKIIEILKKENRFPSQEENKKREEVLAKLDELIKQWIKRVCLKQVCNIGEEAINPNLVIIRDCQKNWFQKPAPS